MSEPNSTITRNPIDGLLPQSHNLLHKKFGWLTVTSFHGYKDERAFWMCSCICGVDKVISAYSLRIGDNVSCGCYNRLQTKNRLTTHGMTNHSSGVYKIWAAMIGRCTVETNAQYRHYGGRGITVCNRWRSRFEDFYSDVGPRPSKEYSLERRDNNKGYSPENVYWATKKQQQQNKRNTIHLTIDGETKTVSEWSEISGVGRRTIITRFFRGYSHKECVFRKPQKGVLRGE
jgi:hypothetical protein